MASEEFKIGLDKEQQQDEGGTPPVVIADDEEQADRSSGSESSATGIVLIPDVQVEEAEEEEVMMECQISKTDDHELPLSVPTTSGSSECSATVGMAKDRRAAATQRCPSLVEGNRADLALKLQEVHHIITSEGLLGGQQQQQQQSKGEANPARQLQALMEQQSTGSEQRPFLPEQLSSSSLPGAISVAGTEYDPTAMDYVSDTLDALEGAQLQRVVSVPFEPENPVQARLVSANSEVFTAELMDDLDPAPTTGQNLQWKDVVQNRTMRYGMMALCVLILVILVALSVGLALNKKETTADPEVQPNVTTASPTLKSYPPIADGMIPQSLEAIAQYPASPAARANAWSWEDPHREDYSTERQLMRFALVAIYYSLGGENWDHNDHWLDYETHECKWYSSQPGGACINGTEWYATNLSSNALSGTLPVEFHHMSKHHVIMDMHSNKIRGPVPPMRRGGKLAYLDISDNQMWGSVTLEAAWANDNLWYLNASGNAISGVVPTFYIGTMPNLEVMDFSYNKFVGDFPDTFEEEATRNNLRILNVAGNQLEGTVPPSLISLVPHLEQVDISDNEKLVGSISEWDMSLANATEFSLVDLDISGTSLTGSVPESLCKLQAVGDLQLEADCGEVECCSR